MKAHELQDLLSAHPGLPLRLMLPRGAVVPMSFHITEVARVNKSFIDCGGARHETRTCQLQAWVGEDDDHRLSAGKLAGILEKAAAAYGEDNLPLEIEYEDGLISQYPVTRVTRENGGLVFHLATKHTDCLAKELCGTSSRQEPAEDGTAASCCGSSGCCGN